MFYLVKTPWIFRKLYPDCLWNVKATDNTLYLTFDDGPNPQVTPFVLDQLSKYNAKATFFCIGKNVKEHFDVYRKIISEGHKVGNHTYNHINGWKTSDKKYLEEVRLAAKIIDTNIFRPPYGRITKFQIKALQGEGFQLKTVMWDVLSGDFDKKVSKQNCYQIVVKNAKPGSIIVFHDSLKAFTSLEYALPRILRLYQEKNYQFKIIP
jgi:peptidoglycan/xylan/chitin deacetylase (PgdA/CDA1 family)